MSEVNFFVPKGPFYLSELSEETSALKTKQKISNIKTIDKATKKDITFLSSPDYKNYAAKTMGYATIYQLCLERSPNRLPNQKVGDPVESPMQHMADSVNEINNQQYLKTMLDRVVNTTDAKEGLKAFKEKRAPKWKQ